ncbi:MAG: histidine--tRNA ligase [Proteobacteria bacterium]|nr:histidine--tRNA ligase [Pseudomonadota bacterium]
MCSSPRKFQAIKGMADILPPDSALWQRVEATARRVFANYGYDEIRTPIAEPTELFRRGVGESTSIVEKEMYSFEDQGGDSIALRPEGTASVVRAYIESGVAASDPVASYYYMGPMFRRERPQKGRQRQFHQIGVELFGVAGPLADAEVIAMFDHFLRELDAPSITLEINSLGCPACRPSFDRALLDYLHRHKGSLCADCNRRIERNPMRALDCKNEGCRHLIDKAPVISEFWCGDCIAHFDAVKRELGLLAIEYRQNPRIVRGLDYYMRTAFEFTTDRLGAQNAVAAGGRYDGLVRALGGPDVAGVGCALGIERLILLLKQHGEEVKSPPVFFAMLGESAREAMLPVIQALRAAGVRVEWDYSARSLKSQMRRADRKGARAVVIVGDDEVAKGEVSVKEMATGEQRAVKLADLTRHFVKVEA